MNEPNWSDCYQILGLGPTAGWNELRAAYRSQIKRWHPDRVGDQPEAKQHADERAKAINNAYSLLTSYYKSHGSLPNAVLTTHRAVPPIDASATAQTTPETHWTNISPEHRGAPTTSRRSSIGTLAIAVSTIALIVYFSGQRPVSVLPSGTSESSPTTTTRTTAPAAGNYVAAPTMSTAPAAPWFSVGSTVGEVYTAQGTPSFTDKDVWHYGTSRVHFVEGRVTHWEEAPENPLHARFDSKPPASAPTVIAPGTTKAEVRAIQGEPVRETPGTWEYGVSRIYFKHDLVTGWEESPLYPLKVRR